MAGIYVHIPFCKSRCIYCGFFSTTSLEMRHDYVSSVIDELARRRDFLHGEVIQTIYFGGGTPSQLPVVEIERIMATIHHLYNVRANAEVTLEGNPDDMTPAYLADLRRVGINRLSMGVQTFDDARLKFLHRRHSASQALQAVHHAQEAQFDNISIDLMFGFPSQTLDSWKQDVQTALSLQVQHLSAYALMYEEGTPLERMLQAAIIAELHEEISLEMYEYLMDAMQEAGYVHYEISNFALPGMESRHNSSYWQGVPYLGVGAGAHSFDTQQRYHNVESLEAYLSGSPGEVEHLTMEERYDEHVFTGLRTAHGIRLSDIEARFGTEKKDFCLSNAQPHLQAGRMQFEGDILRLTRQGLFVSNDIMSDLMWVVD